MGHTGLNEGRPWLESAHRFHRGCASLAALQGELHACAVPHQPARPVQSPRQRPDLSFHSQGAAGFAEELQDALRSGTLFERWKAKQPDPDAVEPQWGVTDPDATVTGEQKDLRINLVATTRIDSDVFKQRLRLLAGHHWELRDVR